MSKYWYKPGIDVNTTDPLVEELKKYAVNTNAYTDLMNNNGVARLRVNGHEYDVVVTNITNGMCDTYPEFTGEIRSLTPRVNFSDYYKRDVEMTKKLYMAPLTPTRVPSIKRVVFSDPCTIVLWSDNTKTIVRTQDGDIYDPEKGLAMAISKKALGNQGNYYEEFKKWLPEEEDVEPIYPDISKAIRNMTMNAVEASKKFAEIMDRCVEEAHKRKENNDEI